MKIEKEIIFEKLNLELSQSGLEYTLIKTEEGIFLEYENEAVLAVVDAHNLDPLPVPKTETEILQEQLLNTQLAMAELIEQTQQDKLDNQLALAELIESIMGGGEPV